MNPVTGITVIYDAECGLCTSTKEWLLVQPTLVNLRMIAAGSAEARARFPQLPAGELAVIADTGDVWMGNHAWLVCLWALREYRELALKLSSPLLLTMAKQAFAVVSRNRGALSRLLRLKSEHEMERELRKVSVMQCQSGAK
jgi:predicted DCC family thiol-disulfide oxidoreductase YuxK